MWLPECVSAGCGLASENGRWPSTTPPLAQRSATKGMSFSPNHPLPNQDLSNLSYHSMLVHPLIDNDGAENKSKWYLYFMILGLPFSFFL